MLQTRDACYFSLHHKNTINLTLMSMHDNYDQKC